jgi:CIC family chloride channel protein
MRSSKSALFSSWKPVQEHQLLLWAAVVGALGALVTEGFRLCLAGAQYLLVGHSGSFVEMARSLPWYWRLSLPCTGSAVAGCFLLWARRLKAGQAADYMESVAIGDGRIPAGHTLLRSASSLATIVSGGSIGREGAMIQLAAMSASALGRWFRFNAARLRLLVACGAAAGITAAYNAPIAGAFFVAEIVLGAIVMESFGPVVIASVVANITMRALPGYKPTYEMPYFPPIANGEAFVFIAMGLMAGLLAPQFLRQIALFRSAFIKLPLPLPLQLATGGLLVGILSVRVPEVWGNGYSVVNSLLHEHWLWSTVLLVLAFKLVATARTVSSGAVGGVFTPMLFVGAAAGNLFAQGMHSLWPQFGSAPYAYSMVGMGAFLAAATGAPLMAIFMIFEMTLSYQIMLPLTLACVVAYFTVKSVDAAAMYEITLKRRRHEKSLVRLRSTQMADLIQPTVTVLPMTASFVDASAMFLRHAVKYIYVVDDSGRFRGVVAAQDITAALVERPEAARETASDFLRVDVLRPLIPGMSLDAALQHFLLHQGERLPIVQSIEDPLLLGVICKSALLDAYSRLHRASLSSVAE